MTPLEEEKFTSLDVVCDNFITGSRVRIEATTGGYV
jgi:hypothetical protein